MESALLKRRDLSDGSDIGRPTFPERFLPRYPKHSRSIDDGKSRASWISAHFLHTDKKTLRPRNWKIDGLKPGPDSCKRSGRTNERNMRGRPSPPKIARRGASSFALVSRLRFLEDGELLKSRVRWCRKLANSESFRGERASLPLGASSCDFSAAC